MGILKIRFVISLFVIVTGICGEVLMDVPIQVTKKGWFLPVVQYAQNSNEVHRSELINRFKNIPQLSGYARKASVCHWIGNGMWIICLASFCMVAYDFGDEQVVNKPALYTFVGTSLFGYGLHVAGQEYLIGGVRFYNESVIMRNSRTSIMNGRIVLSF